MWSLAGIGRVFTDNNLFLLRDRWTRAKTKYSPHSHRAGRTPHHGKQVLRSWTWFVIPHKCTLPVVENEMKDDSWQSDIFPLASRPLPLAFVPPRWLKCIFRCHEGFVQWRALFLMDCSGWSCLLVPYSGQLLLCVVKQEHQIWSMKATAALCFIY